MSERQGNPFLVPLLLVLVLAAAGFFWFGTRHQARTPQVKGAEPAAAPASETTTPAPEKEPPAKSNNAGVIVG